MDDRGVPVGCGCGCGEQSRVDYCCGEQQAEASEAGVGAAAWGEVQEEENEVDRFAQAVGSWR